MWFSSLFFQVLFLTLIWLSKGRNTNSRMPFCTWEFTVRSVVLTFFGLKDSLCAVLSLSVMSDSATPWTTARQPRLSLGILQAGILEWVAMPSFRVSFPSRDQNKSLLWFLHCWWICYCWATEKKTLYPKKHYKQSQKACHNQEEDICNAHNWQISVPKINS